LLKEAIDTTDDVACRYVLLTESRDLAAKSADAATACRAIDLLAEHYGVPVGEMTLAALSSAGRVALTAPLQEGLAAAALGAADRALGRDEFDLAGRLAALGESAAKAAKRITLLTEAQEKVREINWATQEYAHAKAAIETLATTPDDPAAKGAAGRFKCLVKNDWEHGLPLLIDGADMPLKFLAERDQAAATADGTAQFQVADQWWALGDTLIGRARVHCRFRAAYWYRLAIPKISGLPKTLAEKRLDEFDANRLREARLAPGLVGDIYDGATFTKVFGQRVDPNVDNEWPASGRGEAWPKGAFSVRWGGSLRVPASGKYGLSLTVNEGARVFVDDKMVLEEVKGTNKRKPASATVTLSEGAHPIRIEFWDNGGLAKIHLSWQPPGAKGEEVIPARAFVHELSATAAGR
jgi:hypothetical protein